jgi:hypothetical protein
LQSKHGTEVSAVTESTNDRDLETKPSLEILGTENAESEQSQYIRCSFPYIKCSLDEITIGMNERPLGDEEPRCVLAKDSVVHSAAQTKH